MKRRNFREKTQPLVMIIPMIDIMLFLLVFFMLSTIYMVQIKSLPVNLPKSETAAQDTRPNTILITVTAQGEIFFDKDSVPNQNIAEKVRAALIQDKNTIFVLRGDKSARYESVVAALDLLKKSGASRVSIATELKK